MGGALVSFGDDIFETAQPAVPLIEEVLWDYDVAMLLGQEKAGKSIMGMQIAFSLASGAPFLGKYKVPEAYPVVYLQTEGKHDEMVKRLNRMHGHIRVNSENFCHIYRKRTHIDIESQQSLLAKSINVYKEAIAPRLPKLLVIDSLYSSMSGDMEKNRDTQKFQDMLEGLLTETGITTAIILHHDSKPPKDLMGKEVDRGDKGSFGSVYWRAYVEHILYLRANLKTRERKLSCDTQRTGEVMEQESLTLVEPDPLYFRIRTAEEKSREAKAILHLSMKTGVSKDRLCQLLRQSPRTVERALGELMKRKWVRVNGSRPAKYYRTKAGETAVKKHSAEGSFE